MIEVIIRTVGQADLWEEITFNSQAELHMGDLVDLKVTKPADSPVYGQARVTGYEGWSQGYPVKFKAVRIA